MIGDKLVIKPHHTEAAEGTYPKIKEKMGILKEECVGITVAGESGSGKSEIAAEIKRLLFENDNISSIILAQDDYFRLPPRSNDRARRQEIKNVGMQEVNLDLMDAHIKYLKTPELMKECSIQPPVIVKPLVDYENDRIGEEIVDINSVKVVIAEGTYTTALKNADIRIFIDRTYLDTLQHRIERGRDKLDEYTEKILKIEHDIISEYKSKADIIIKKDYSVEI